MKLILDTDAGRLTSDSDAGLAEYDLYSREAFELVSAQWLKLGWNEKYTYTFTWLGRPIIQLPEDMFRMQEVIFRVRPDVIIETGVAHGGSLVYYAGLCKLLGKGRVIGIDIEIRPANRKAIESHFLFPLISLIEGNSVAPETVQHVKALLKARESVMVVLDSAHAKDHVRAELEAYHGLVSPGSYIVATDGIMKDLPDVPRAAREWAWNNPAAAALKFAEAHSEFILEDPSWPFNESNLSKAVTHWQGGWLRRR
jgi:cephalosporin hydroxylase